MYKLVTVYESVTVQISVVVWLIEQLISCRQAINRLSYSCVSVFVLVKIFVVLSVQVVVFHSSLVCVTTTVLGLQVGAPYVEERLLLGLGVFGIEDEDSP